MPYPICYFVCFSGEDISVCVCLAILTSLFDEEGTYLYFAFDKVLFSSLSLVIKNQHFAVFILCIFTCIYVKLYEQRVLIDLPIYEIMIVK